MRVLFIGGTGIISTACARLALARGFDLTLLNRGRRSAVPGARMVVADVSDPAAAGRALEGLVWDAVVDFISFTPADIENRLALLRDRARQFIFISSASVYQRPVTDYLVTESTPLANPFWEYSRDKIACEERLLRALREERFPAVIVRPSYTYGETTIPVAINSSAHPYTVVDRLRRGAPVIVPGDGTSLWTNTHNSDFAKGLVGLLGHQRATGHAFHITSDEVLNWNQIYQAVAEAAGVSRPTLVHIASDFITACMPEKIGGLHGDKASSVVLDNSKIKRFVPGFVATTRFRDGIEASIAWYDADPARRTIDEKANARWDRLIAAYEAGLEAAKREFATDRM
jgi:nucleoside-diphosphate-sugar epimerase